MVQVKYTDFICDRRLQFAGQISLSYSVSCVMIFTHDDWPALPVGAALLHFESVQLVDFTLVPHSDFHLNLAIHYPQLGLLSGTLMQSSGLIFKQAFASQFC